MKIQIDVPEHRIADIMTSAIEGNSMTRAWCAGVYLLSMKGRRVSNLPGIRKGLWYNNPKTFESCGFRMEVVEIIDEAKQARGDNLRHHAVGRLNLREGIGKMAEHASEHFGDWMNEREDAVTADVFLQMVALGEVRYG